MFCLLCIDFDFRKRRSRSRRRIFRFLLICLLWFWWCILFVFVFRCLYVWGCIFMLMCVLFGCYLCFCVLFMLLIWLFVDVCWCLWYCLCWCLWWCLWMCMLRMVKMECILLNCVVIILLLVKSLLLSLVWRVTSSFWRSSGCKRVRDIIIWLLMDWCLWRKDKRFCLMICIYILGRCKKREWWNWVWANIRLRCNSSTLSIGRSGKSL